MLDNMVPLPPCPPLALRRDTGWRRKHYQRVSITSTSKRDMHGPGWPVNLSEGQQLLKAEFGGSRTCCCCCGIPWYSASDGNRLYAQPLPRGSNFKNNNLPPPQEKHMKHPTITSFFDSVSEYKHFFQNRVVQRKATQDFTCMAILRKKRGKYQYFVHFKDVGCWISENVRPFTPNEKMLKLFNDGVAECARRLQIYFDTGERITGLPPAFGILSCESPDELAPPPIVLKTIPTKILRPERCEFKRLFPYFPNILDSRVVKRYQAGQYNVVLLTEVICSSSVQNSHLLLAYPKGKKDADYAIAAEFNGLSLMNGGETHSLRLYNKSGHINLACSDDWSNISAFERKARELMELQLGTQLVEV